MKLHTQFVLIAAMTTIFPAVHTAYYFYEDI